MVWARTPMTPRRTLPCLRICSKTERTMLDGAAKPMPSSPPDCEAMSVLSPTI